jgi:pimeloyl-ACP methyl ester carboxylesterase
VAIAFRDVPAAHRDASGSGERTPVLLIHGSPGSGRVFDGLVDQLMGPRRLIVPDLPGFGASSPEIPDYSFAAHADYLDALLDRLHVPTAHVVGFSMGGGAALTMTGQPHAHVASLTMLSAIGVQELELLGDYHLNHVLHGAQAAGLWAFIHLVPHRGTLDGGWSYARNFYDSDQRPLRRLLAGVQAPALIVHGSDDPLVPVEAAREHARLLPQAELHIVDDGHFMAVTDPARVAPRLAAFFDRVDAGAGVPRLHADRLRVEASRRPFDARVIPRARAITAAVLGTVIALGSAVLGGWSHVAAGVLAGQGRASLALAVGGVLVGSGVAALARRSNRTGRPPLRATAWALGAALYGAALSPVVLAWLGNRDAWLNVVLATGVLAPTGLVLSSVATHRRRRLLLSSWRRLARWEYWPLWVSYLPVCAYIAWLMLKHRSATVFTASNPGIEAGGVVGESKFAILRALGLPAAHVAPTLFLPADLSVEAKRARVRAFTDERGLALPLVVKPDAGQRGSGVVVVRTQRALDDALAATGVDVVVQAFVPGEEFGVFYYRRPSEPRGHILSVTRKHLPLVTGDGRRTLERLILDDDRATCMARFHLAMQHHRLGDVPRAGEAVSLGDCGSHCRGALFLDGAALATEALREALDRIAQPFHGFYFGRFDVRVPSADALAEGRDIVVLELNGVTSEATHIYDPAVSIGDAYQALFTQWRLAFEIGAENVRRGVRPASLGHIVRLARRYRADARRHLE